jgi:hypothetical protein
MSAEQANLWDGLVQMGKELKSTHAAGFLSAALTFAYVCIDTMSYLSLPSEKSQQDRSDFMAWVDTYLKGDPSQSYEYRGLDVYAARCAVLHAFSAEAELHRKDPGVRVFGYHDGGHHVSHPHLVVIGIASFVNDIVRAIEAFLAACQDDADLRARVEPRLGKVLHTFPIQAP